MAEYRLKSGAIVTDEDIERIAEAAARGNLPGEWSGEAVVGRPRISDERLITVPVKFPESVVAKIDAKTNNRSDFIRKAVISCL